MLAHELGHLEQVDLRLAEHRLELVIGVDLALVGGVLQLALLDVVPQTLDHFGTSQGFVTHDRRRRCVNGAQRD